MTSLRMARCILCNGTGLHPGLSRIRACPLCEGVAGWPEALPSVREMNRTGEVGEAIRSGVVFREIRAVHDEETIRVYQAYNVELARAACEANSFQRPLALGKWSATRMTWIKPSAVWMAYRCGWTVMKDKNQAAVIALDLSKPRFLELLRTAMLSHGAEARATKDTPVVVQWDPERVMFAEAGKKTEKEKEKDCHTRGVQQMRSIQIGLRGKGVECLLDPDFVLRITDVTEDFRRAHAALTASPPNTAAAAAALWPDRQEERMLVPAELRDLLQMNILYDPDHCGRKEQQD